MFGLFFTEVHTPTPSPTPTNKDETKPNKTQGFELNPCPYSPHPTNRRLARLNNSLSSSGYSIPSLSSECKAHVRNKSHGSSSKSLPSLIYYSDADDSDCSDDEIDPDAHLERADANALSVKNLQALALDVFGSKHFDEIKHQYVTVTSRGNVGLKLEVRGGLMTVKKICKQSPLYGMLHKYDIISTINEVDMDGLTAGQAESLLSKGGKMNHHHFVVFRVEREQIASVPLERNVEDNTDISESTTSNVDISESLKSDVDISGSLHVCCRKGDISLI